MSTPDETSEGFEADGPDELLVAYLDGQLDAEECERLESRLAEDQPTRERLQSLDRVWNALDALPRSTASPAFTRSTVEMAAVTAAKPAVAGPTANRWRPPLWLLASGIAAVCGGMLAWTVAGAPERRAVRDLPVALHAAALEQAGSLEFLQEFAANAAGRLDAFRTDELAQEAAEWEKLASSTPPERSDWVAALPSADLAAVNERLAAYQAMTDAKRSHLVEVCEELSAKPNVAELREMALVYESMVERLPASEQLRLRQMETEPRLRTIERQAPKWARQRVLELTDAEKQRFRRAIETAAKDGGFAKIMQERFPGLPPEARDRMRDRPHLAPVFVTGFVANSDRRRPPPFDGDDRAEQFFERIKAAWRDWLEKVQAGLPARVQELLDEASSDERRARLLITLLRETGTSDLGAAFSELPDNEIDELLLLSKEEFETALSDRMVGSGPDPGWREEGRGGRRSTGPPPGFGRFPGGEPREGRSRFDGPQRRPPSPRRERTRGEGRPPFNDE